MCFTYSDGRLGRTKRAYNLVQAETWDWIPPVIPWNLKADKYTALYLELEDEHVPPYMDDDNKSKQKQCVNNNDTDKPE